MTDSDNNVIEFPERRDPEEIAKELATQLVRDGGDPAALLAQILHLASPQDLLPTRRQPSLPPVPATPHRYRVRVDLDGATPPIWRRLELASDLTLADLHEVLQTAMGWTDSHLHHFLSGPKRDYSVMPFLTAHDEGQGDEEEGDEGINERDVRVDQVLVEVGDRLIYEYDFGDGWDHTIRLEAIQPYDDSSPRTRVVTGRRACPPEDCGGIGGYEDLLEALTAGTAADEYQRDRLEWLGGDFDPDAFSATDTDELMQLTLASLGGSAGVGLALEMAGTGCSEVLDQLVERSSREPKPLSRLLAAAELTRLDEPDAAGKAQMVLQWVHLLRVVGPGLKLTSSGWLPPAVAHGIATDLGILEPWMGKGNREQNFPPVRLLRETATSLGLLRKRKGELLPTALGSRLADDPDGLWRHVVGALPLGRKDFERHAGAIMLLALAAGEAPSDGIRHHGVDLLWSAGWSDPGGGPPTESAAIEFARPTWDVLRVAGCSPRILTSERVTEPARQFARAALRAH